MGDAEASRFAIDAIADHFAGVPVDRVLGIERDFHGSARPWPTGWERRSCRRARAASCRGPWRGQEFILEYGNDILEIHRDGVLPGERILIVDDVLATGGTAGAAVRLVEGLGGEVVGLGFVIELVALGGRARLNSDRAKLGDRDIMALLGVGRRGRRGDGGPGASVATAFATGGTTSWGRSSPPSRPPSEGLDGHHPAGLRRRGQRPRRPIPQSGEKYINHPLAVAHIVADIGLDDTTLAASAVPRRRGGHRSERGRCRAPVRRRDRRHRRRCHQARPAALRLQGGAAGRHHAQDVGGDGQGPPGPDHQAGRPPARHAHPGGLPADKQARTAQETLDIYAPLAHRLGMAELKQQLEDLSFASLHPKRYAEIDHMVSLRTPERDVYLARVVAEVPRIVSPKLHIDADVTGRPKHLWSIYEKMVVKGKEFDEIFDLVAIRVIVDSVKDCYAALGSIHGTWKPVVGRFKDYIAMPKFNLYQSLHTTVIGPQGEPLEVQIRTHEMHQRAEWGVAAHWSYKEGSPSDDIAWLNRIIDWQKETQDPAQFMENLKTDLEQDEVFVFTPKGRVITLPVGRDPDRLRVLGAHRGRARLHRCPGERSARAARPHPPVGRHVRGVHLQGRGRRAIPRLDEDRQVTRARNKIRQWFSRERRETPWSPVGRADPRAAAGGAAGAEADGLRRAGQGSAAMNFADLDALYVAIGEHHVSGRSVAQRVAVAPPGEEEEQLPSHHHQAPPSASGPHRRRRPRRGARRRHGATVPVLHAGARRRHHRLHHPWPRRHRAPGRLRQRRRLSATPSRPA